jgi:hypothetical protein
MVHMGIDGMELEDTPALGCGEPVSRLRGGGEGGPMLDFKSQSERNDELGRREGWYFSQQLSKGWFLWK